MDSIEANGNAKSSILYSPGNYDSLKDAEHTEREPASADDTVNAQDKGANVLSFSKLPARSKCTLLLCFLSNTCVGCSFAVLAPFFPQEAQKKGMSTTLIGLIFSVFELIMFISSPLFGNYIVKIGAKFMFTSGMCVGASCSFMFGLMDKCPPGITFIVMCFATRCVQALSLAGFVTSSFAILSNEFPNNVATVIGLQETALGIGMMIGPAIGGGLYELAGYGMPFFVLGGSIILIGLCIPCILPPPKEVTNQRKGSLFRLLSSPRTLISMLSAAACAFGMSSLEPIFSTHLGEFYLSPGMIGLMFVISPALYGLVTPLFGYLVDNKNFVGSLIVPGHLVFGISFFFIGPSPLLPFLPFKLWVIIVGSVLLGIGLGCAVIPNMKCLVLGALEIGFEDNLDTFGVVSGLYNSMFCLGSLSGPMVGGVLVSRYGFKTYASVVAMLHMFVSITALIFFLVHHWKQKRLEQEQSPKYGEHFATLKPDCEVSGAHILKEK